MLSCLLPSNFSSFFLFHRISRHMPRCQSSVVIDDSSSNVITEGPSVIVFFGWTFSWFVVIVGDTRASFIAFTDVPQLWQYLADETSEGPPPRQNAAKLSDMQLVRVDSLVAFESYQRAVTYSATHVTLTFLQQLILHTHLQQLILHTRLLQPISHTHLQQLVLHTRLLQPISHTHLQQLVLHTHICSNSCYTHVCNNSSHTHTHTFTATHLTHTHICSNSSHTHTHLQQLILHTGLHQLISHTHLLEFILHTRLQQLILHTYLQQLVFWHTHICSNCY